MSISASAVAVGLPADSPPTESQVDPPYAMEAAAVAQSFTVDPAAGLSPTEVEQRRARYGDNALATAQSRAAWRILLDQFKSLVVALLTVAAVVAWLTGDKVEAVAILVVLGLNALIGFVTEWQAGRALNALRQSSHTTARVRREQREAMIDTAELVPGDVVILNSGDRVPADLRLLEAASLRAEESALTGGSAPVEKAVAAVAAEAVLAERHSMLYLGTIIAAGRALALVTATGAQTEMGRIGHLVASVPDESTPLERRLDEMGRHLVLLVLVIAAVVMVTGWLRGETWWVMIEVGISLAVAAVPEGLPAVTTLILALGVMRMARERAIVRRLSAVETLGSATVICSDKTGTLTENRMTVREYQLANGKAVKPDAPPANDELLNRAIRAGVLCNEAAFHPEAKEKERATGDPTEIALLVTANALKVDVAQMRADYPKLAERPFDSDSKRMTTIHRMPDGARLALLKGAPGVVFETCIDYAETASQVRELDAETRARFLATNEQMADQAMRVLALAEKRLNKDGSDDDAEAESASGYTLLGLVGMIDPPRPEAAEAIRLAHAAGIRTVMLTGDQLNTARAIARELKLSDEAEPLVLHARELADVDPARLAELAHTVTVFARVSPEDKLRIVEALQKAGEVVAVTGDGVNDAPALKRADIGIAMGERGTEAAKEAADVVLADDNFATIVGAVAGGRAIYANITKFVNFMFSSNLGEVVMIFTAIAIGWPLPLLPLQILWVNLVTDVFPALALAVEPPAADVMQQNPRSSTESLLSRSLLILISWQGVMLGGLALAAYLWALNAYGPGPHARTIAMLALVGAQLGHLFNCRSRSRSAMTGLFTNGYIWGAAAIVIALQLLAVWWSPLTRVLQTVAPNPTDWWIVVLSVLAPIVIVEVTKLITRRGPVKK
ncbi:MAG: calcium-translocating P-type ATPase, PMCA-type [Blastocatellia bacterium]